MMLIERSCQKRVPASGNRAILRGLRVSALIALGLLVGSRAAVADEGVSEGAMRDRLSAAAEAEASARRAEEAAGAARAFADRLAAEIEESQRPPGGGAPAPKADTPVTRADLEEAVRRAESAADDAWLAARVAERIDRKAKQRGARSRPYFGAAVAYAAENFEDRIIVKSGLAGAAFLGYRFSPFVAAELRYDGFDGFELKAANGRGEIDGYAITMNAKIYPIIGPIQPFLGVGLGGIHLKSRAIFPSGARSHSSGTDVVFRFFGGLDLPLTDHVVLNFEAAYLVPGDELSQLEIAVLGGGLTYRF